MDSTADMLWHPESGSKSIDGSSRVCQDGKLGDFQSLTNRVNIIYD